MDELIERGLLASMSAFVAEHARGVRHEPGDAIILIAEAHSALTTLQAREATLIRVLDDLLDYALVHCSALTEESSIVVRAKEAIATSELVER